MQVSTLKSGSVSEILALLSVSRKGEKSLFRGQKRSEWKLIPTLYREEFQSPDDNNDLQYQSHYKELSFISHFFQDVFRFNIHKSSNLALDLSVMQHFGAPTRLLDWTKDPMVAIFFALSDNEPDSDAAIFSYTNASYSSYINFEGKSFSEIDQSTIISFTPPVFDDRVAAQRSVFTIQPFLCGSSGYTCFEDRVPDQMKKVIIPKDMKECLFAELISFGIDRSNLFPSPQGVGENISSLAKRGILQIN